MEPCQDYYYNEEISFASNHVPLSSLFILSSCASTHPLLPICLVYLFHFYFNSLPFIPSLLLEQQAKSEYDRVSASQVLQQRAYTFHILLSFLFFSDWRRVNNFKNLFQTGQL